MAMIDEKLLVYIKQLLVQGKSVEEIKQQLQIAGWQEAIIDETIKQAGYTQQTQASFVIQPQNTNGPYQETTRIKIVALWLFILGIIGILLGLGLFISGILSLSLLSPDSYYPFLNTAFSFITGLIFISFSILMFRTRSALHKLEIEGYQAAMVHFIAIELGGLLALPIFILILKQQEQLIFTPVALVINGLFLSLLYSQRRLFTNHTIQILRMKVVVVVILLFLTMPFGIYLQTSAKSYEKAQIKEALRETARKNREKNPEPIISSWESYINNEYNFSLDVPFGWYRKEYLSEYGQGKKIAFGPDELADYLDPEASYFFIDIFPTSDQSQYTSFQKRMSKVGQKPLIHKEAVLGGVKGEETLGTTSVEYQGYVYELALPKIEDDNLNFQYSDISKRILSSFKFSR